MITILKIVGIDVVISFGVVLRCVLAPKRELNSMFFYRKTKLTPNPIHLTALYQLIHDLFSLSFFFTIRFLSFSLKSISLSSWSSSSPCSLCISYSNMFASYLISSPAQSLSLSSHTRTHTHTISHSCPHALVLLGALYVSSSPPHCTRTHTIFNTNTFKCQQKQTTGFSLRTINVYGVRSMRLIMHWNVALAHATLLRRLSRHSCNCCHCWCCCCCRCRCLLLPFAAANALLLYASAQQYTVHKSTIANVNSCLLCACSIHISLISNAIEARR